MSTPDTVMNDTNPQLGPAGPTSMEQEPSEPEVNARPQPQPTSYKESLMGFNGVDNGGYGINDDEELMSDVFEREWELPEPTEEILHLMDQLPVVPISAEEYSEWCKP